MQAHPLSTTASPTEPAFPLLQPLEEGPGFAHDAGNLLGALTLYSDLLGAPGVLQPQHQHYAAELRVLSERSTLLIRRLLHSADPPASRLAVSLRALEPLLERIASPDAALAFDLQTDLPPLPFAAEALERIVLNLVRNAADALRRQRHPHGRIAVSLARHDATLTLTVADNGPGMEPILASRFFHPPSASTARTGLGHRIIHDLVRSTGGALELRIRPGRGSVFSITWPLANAVPGVHPTEGATAPC